MTWNRKTTHVAASVEIESISDYTCVNYEVMQPYGICLGHRTFLLLISQKDTTHLNGWSYSQALYIHTVCLNRLIRPLVFRTCRPWEIRTLAHSAIGRLVGLISPCIQCNCLRTRLFDRQGRFFCCFNFQLQNLVNVNAPSRNRLLTNKCILIYHGIVYLKPYEFTKWTAWEYSYMQDINWIID